jgi:hypothetical protein
MRPSIEVPAPGDRSVRPRLPRLAILACAWLLSSAAARAALLWPLEIPGVLLSTFGEYRYDHLHAGIDISTRGGTGYKVRAADAGVVFRLKVEWRGYGRALYLRHANGRVTVYGHLERYEDSVLHLERVVARRQAEARSRYPGDIFLDPPVRVRRGQVIAYSGESGVGLPHLHFEVRDGGDAPMNPFDAGLPRPPDTRRPVLDTLTILSASPECFVEGEAREEVYPLRPGADGVRTTARPVRVSGPFLALANAYDPAGDSGRAGVQGVEMTIDGRSSYRLGFRTFRFGQYPQSGLIYDHRTSRLGPAAFTYRLFRLPGNELSAAIGPQGEVPPDGYPGAIDLDPGAHVMEVSVVDSAGNRSRARVCVQVGRPQAAQQLAWQEAGDPAHAWATFRFPEGKPPRAAAPGAGPKDLGCRPPPARAVEGEAWDEERSKFRPITCSLSNERCVVDSGTAARPRALRVREVRDGAPGPWRLLAGSTAKGPDAGEPAARVDAWPAFLDVLVPADVSGGASFLLAAGTSATPILPLAYRTDSLWGGAVAYRDLSGRSPLSVAAGGPRSPASPLVLDVRWAEPGQTIQYQGPGFSLSLPAGGRFFAGPLAVRTEPIAGPPSLPAVSEAVDVLPEGEALNEPATLAFDLVPEAVPPQSLGVYRYDASRDRWGFEGGDLDAGETRMVLRFRRYGRFALLQDATPPAILEVRPAPGARAQPRRLAVQARVEEEGKGLDFNGVTIAVDDRPIETEFDPDRGLAKGFEPLTLSPGRHHIRVEAVDRAGNHSAVVEGDFNVR